MKAIQSIRYFLPVVIFSFIMMAASLEASSQNRRNNHKSDKNNERKEYRGDRSDNHSVARNNVRSGDRNHYEGHKSDGNHGDYSYSEHNSGRRYNGHQQAYTNHPRYGRVYQTFEHKPYVFRHSHGNYYYSDNQFYTYRDRIGYSVSEPPRDVYFDELPFECSRVHVNGHDLYRNGDLYFSHSTRGYIIVPPPLAINFSIGF